MFATHSPSDFLALHPPLLPPPPTPVSQRCDMAQRVESVLPESFLSSNLTKCKTEN